MTIPAIVPRQRDFSAGQVDEHAKRRDDVPLLRSGARQAVNFRPLNTGALSERPSRAAQFVDGRCDEVRINSTTNFQICFGHTTLTIRDSNGNVMAAWVHMPWTSSTARDVVWTRSENEIIIFFPNIRPLVAQWDGSSTWTLYDFTFAEGIDGIDRVPYSRIAALGITVTPSALSGSITVTFDADVLVSGHVGAMFRIVGRRVLITAVTDARTGTATVLDKLFRQKRITTTGTPDGFSLGDVVIGSDSEAQGQVLSVDEANKYVYVQLITGFTGFTTSDTLIGPNDKQTITAVDNVASGSHFPTVIWDEQAISDGRGWPQSGAVDQNRLILCDIPGIPEAILWSRVDQHDDFDIDGTPEGAIGEFMTGEPRVFHVVGGNDEFVFTDQGIFYIPISESNPLRSGSVTFRRITATPVARVLPAHSDEAMLFINAEKTRVMGLIPTGQTAAPYIVRDLTELHTQLFNAPFALAVTKPSASVPEKYALVVNIDGTVVVGKAVGRDAIGWVPWNGEGDVKWVSSRESNVFFTTNYAFGGTERMIVEKFDPDVYVDAAIRINAIPAPLVPGSGIAAQIFAKAGSAFGNMSANAGRAIVFSNAGARVVANSAGRVFTEGFVGRLLQAAQVITHAEVWPSSDQGFDNIGGAHTVTLELRADNANPSVASDGVLLGTTTLSTDPVGTKQTITNTAHPTATYRYVWVRIISLTATEVYMSALRFYTIGTIQLAPNGASGSLWMMAGGTVDVTDGYRYLGTRSVDASGQLVLVEEEDLSGAGITVGLKYTNTFEPFVQHAPEGSSQRQTHRKRKVKYAITVQRSTGFVFGNRRIPPYRQGEDEGAAPALREETYIFKPLGRSHDPRHALVKDVPGPLRIIEVAPDVTV